MPVNKDKKKSRDPTPNTDRNDLTEDIFNADSVSNLAKTAPIEEQPENDAHVNGL